MSESQEAKKRSKAWLCRRKHKDTAEPAGAQHAGRHVQPTIPAPQDQNQGARPSAQVQHVSADSVASPRGVQHEQAALIVAEALTRLNDDQRKLVAQPQVDLFQATIAQAGVLKERCESTKRWQFRGHEVVPRDVATTVCTFLKSLEKVGDTVADLGPLYVQLPWAGVKAAVEMGLALERQRGQLLKGLEYVLFYTKRLQVYVELFTSAKSDQLASQNFWGTLVDCYACILEFMAAAIRTDRMNALQKTAQALWSCSALADFATKMEACRDKLREDADLRVKLTETKHQQALMAGLQRLDEVHTSVQRIELKLNLATLDAASVPDAKHNSYQNSHSRQCLEGTRLDLLQLINDWITAPQDRIFWLCGKAGTGKSTIARTVAHNLEKEIMISFFFKRREEGRDNAKRLVPTLVQQLVHAIPSMRPHVAAALEKNSTVCSSDIGTQFRILLEQPLKACETTADIYVVLDALDECVREDIMDVVKQFMDFNCADICMSVFLTSRPEAFRTDWYEYVQKAQELFQHSIKMEEVGESTITGDLRHFIDSEFRAMKQSIPSLPTTWPAEQQLEQLVELSTPLFIAAATYCKHIRARPQKYLAQIIEQRPTINDMYLPILSLVVEEDVQEFVMIVGAIVLAFDSLTVDTLTHLLGLEAEDVTHILDYLPSILTTSAGITFHKSFADYLLAPTLKESFRIDKLKTNQMLFEKCIHLIDELQHDVLQINYPGILRSEVDDPVSCISPAVQYACRYWVRHALEGQIDVHTVVSFLKRALLRWIETMSWLEEVPRAIDELLRLSRCLHAEHALVRDAIKFLVSQRTAIELAPIQTYVSALHYTPPESLVKQCFVEVFRRFTEPLFERMQAAEQELESPLWTRPLNVVAACSSSDNKFVAVLTRDGTVHHCDAITGSTLYMFETFDRYEPSLGAKIVYSKSNGLLIVVHYWQIYTGNFLSKSITKVVRFDGGLIVQLLSDGTLALLEREPPREFQNDLRQSGDTTSSGSSSMCESGVDNDGLQERPTALFILDAAQDWKSRFICDTPRGGREAKFSAYNNLSVVLMHRLPCLEAGKLKSLELTFQLWTKSKALARVPVRLSVDAQYHTHGIEFALSQSGMLLIEGESGISAFDVQTGDVVWRLDLSNPLHTFRVFHGRIIVSLDMYGNVDIVASQGPLSGRASPGYMSPAHGRLETFHDGYKQAIFNNLGGGITMDQLVRTTPTGYRKDSDENCKALYTDTRSSSIIATSWRGRAQLWRIDGTSNGKPFQLHSEDFDFQQATLAPGGRFVLSTSKKGDDIRLDVWSLYPITKLSSSTIFINTRGPIVASALSSDGTKAAVGHADSFRVIDLVKQSSEIILPMAAVFAGQPLIFAPEEGLLAVGGYAFGGHIIVKIYNLQTQEIVAECQKKVTQRYEATTLHWSGDCQHLDSSCDSIVVQLGDYVLHVKPSGSWSRRNAVPSRWIERRGTRYMYSSKASEFPEATIGRTLIIAPTIGQLSFYTVREQQIAGSRSRHSPGTVIAREHNAEA